MSYFFKKIHQNFQSQLLQVKGLLVDDVSAFSKTLQSKTDIDAIVSEEFEIFDKNNLLKHIIAIEKIRVNCFKYKF